MKVLLCYGETEIAGMLKKTFPQHPPEAIAVHIHGSENIMYCRLEVNGQKIYGGGDVEVQERITSFLLLKNPTHELKVRVRCRKNIVFMKVFAEHEFDLIVA